MRDYTPLDIDIAPISLDGYKEKTYRKQGLEVTIRKAKTLVTTIASKEIDYSVSTQDSMSEVLTSELKKVIKSLKLPQKNRFLVIGLGNAGMTADALGSKTLDKIAITPMEEENKLIATFAPSVKGLTAIDSNLCVKGIVKMVKPHLVLLVDTLATSDIEKLARVVQVKNTGLVPGGGVGADKPSLDIKYLGVPVVTIGVPLVIYLRHVVATYIEDNHLTKKMDQSTYTLVVTPKEIDFTVDYFSTIVANSINEVLQQL